MSASALPASALPAPTHPSGAHAARASAAGHTRRHRGEAARDRRRHERELRNKRRREAQAHERAARRQSSVRSERQQAATIAAVLATPCANTELTPTAANAPAVDGAVLCLVNRERAEHGELPLTLDAQLQAAAESHVHELIAADYFAHVAPDGETPVDRIKETGYLPNPADGYVLGENLAWGTYDLSTPASIVAAWIASPGHLANILEGQYRETGIAVTPAVPEVLAQGAPGATYAQEFGVVIP